MAQSPGAALVYITIGLVAACFLVGAGYWLARLKGSAPFADTPNGNLHRSGQPAPFVRSKGRPSGGKLKPKVKTEQEEWEMERGN